VTVAALKPRLRARILADARCRVIVRLPASDLRAARDVPPYESLDVSDGGQAMVATQEMLDPATTPQRRAEIRKALLAYCERDTLAMVEVYRALRRAGGRDDASGDA
jgi:hypothetical protein